MVKKRICLVIASPLTINFFLLGHIAVLAKEYDLTVITNTDDLNFLAHLGVPIKVSPVVIERNVSLWSDLKALMQLVFIFFRERFDSVHSLSPKSGLLAMIAAWIVNVPIRIHTFQGEVWITRKGLWRSFLKFLDKLVARCATHLLVVSLSEQKFLVEQGVVPRGRLQILANGSICGVDTARFKPDLILRTSMRASIGIPDADTVILYLGRLTMDKGLLILADAFSRVAAMHDNVHLLVVGPDEEGMQDKIRIHCVNGFSRLHFADYTSSPEIYMAGSDLLCLPSYREGFGLVLIEAAATGIATIGSRIYGIVDAIVDNETGLLFTAGDVADLTKKIEILFADPTLRRVLGENGRVRTSRYFSKELVLSELLRYYKNLLSV
jgi:glycosyltransferase involved in cell wall biosynthesis